MPLIQERIFDGRGYRLLSAQARALPEPRSRSSGNGDMEIFDSHAHTMRDLDSCEVAEHVNGLIPVLSTKDDQWFAVSMFSGSSHTLGDLEPEDLSDVRESIAAHLFSKLLLSACHQVDSGEEPSKAQALLARVDYARRFGNDAIEAAEQRAFAAGFTAEDIGCAYNLMEVDDPATAVPVTKVSDLQKG
jgi:hypothetical protein